MKAAFVIFLAICALVRGDDKATPKVEDISKEKSVPKRGLIGSHTIGTGINVGTIGDVVKPHGTNDGILIGDAKVPHGIYDVGAIGAPGLCDHGVIHRDFHHSDLSKYFHHHYVPATPVVQTLKIERPVAVPVPEHFKVSVEHPVPVVSTVPEPFKVHVPRPYAVPVDKKVEYEVIKHVPVEVEERVPYTVKKLVPYPVVRRIPYLVHVPVHKPVHVTVPKAFPVVLTRRVPYLVDKYVPHPVQVKEEVSVPHHVPYDVPKPYAVSVPHPVPVHVDRPVAVHVPKPVPVHVTQRVPVPVPHPVPVPIIKHLPVPFEEAVHVPIPVHKSLHVDIPVHKDVHVDFPITHSDYIHKTGFDSTLVGLHSIGQTGVLTKAVPTALPPFVTTPTPFFPVGGTTIRIPDVISANGVKYSGNSFSFGTKFNAGTHGSFDLTPRDTNYFIPSSTLKPDVVIDLNSQTSSVLEGLDIPASLKVSRSSEENKGKSEILQQSTKDSKKIKT